ncbi:MAG: undecaprenyl-diphosphate phosphatase, partial [Planctomycetes bacterium]|nr:undecaprenyl-diphosphate phosphatase [Planctomycetota bacterium]
MSELDYLTAALLGALQGLTEFLPISSSAHLALTQRWFDLDPQGAEMLLFDVLVHLATLAAVVIVFRRSALRFCHRLYGEATGASSGRRCAWWIVLLAMAATVPTGVIGLLFKDHFEAAFGKPRAIGTCLMVTGCLLIALVMVPRGRRGWRALRWWEAALIGLAQAIAILPGISRSGSTICVASYFGWRRRWAVEFSFLIAAPAIAGGAILKIKDTFDLSPEALQSIDWGPILLGSGVSLVAGIFALMLLLQAVRRAR